MQLSALALAGFLGLATAQSVRVHVVQVGNGGQTFAPSDLRANPGDMVQFQFMGGNHTATQSNFDNPCQPISAFNNTNPGFHSGFIPAAASASMGQIATYTIMVNNTSPIWVYCAQGRHCEGGMNMVINANQADQTRSLQAYRQLASQAQTVVPGGGEAGQQGGQPGSVPAAAAGSSLAVPSTLGLLAALAFLL